MKAWMEAAETVGVIDNGGQILSAVNYALLSEKLLQEILSHRVEYITQDSFFKTSNAMCNAAWHINAVSLIYNLGFIANSKFKTSFGNISNLKVFMTVEISFSSLFKMNLAHHKLI